MSQLKSCLYFFSSHFFSIIWIMSKSGAPTWPWYVSSWFWCCHEQQPTHQPYGGKKVYQQQNAVQNYGMTRKKNKLNQQKRKNQNKNFLKGTSLCEILFDTSTRITHQGHQLSICFRQLLIFFFNADIFLDIFYGLIFFFSLWIIFTGYYRCK